MRINFQEIGFLSFNLGIFFLSSALPIAGLFIIISMFFSFQVNGSRFLNDKWNYPFFIASLLMIFSNIKNYLNTEYQSFSNITIHNENHIKEILGSNNSWIDLFNWLPFFLLFWSSQNFLKSYQQREIVARSLIIGSVPVIFSCIRQFWFGSYGPFKTLYGLIVWFQVPPNRFEGSVTGLFSNPNYCGFWLAIILPFTYYFFRSIKLKKIYKLFLFFLLALNLYFILMTNSRNALISLLVTLKFIFSIKVFMILVIAILLFLITSIFIPTSLINLSFLSQFSKDILFEGIKEIDQFTRIEIWKKSIKLISLKPLLGWGSGFYPLAYILINGKWQAQHTHNMPLELAFNFGIPVSLILTLFISFIFFKTYRILYSNSSLNKIFDLNKCWFAASTIFLINHLTDITYYDGKISLLIWVLLAGMKCIVNEKECLKKNEIALKKS